MKRIIALITCSLLALACLSSFAEETALTCESIAEAALASAEFRELTDMTERYMEKHLSISMDISAADFEEWVMKRDATRATPEMILVLKVRETADQAAIRQCIQEFNDEQLLLYRDYQPAQVFKLENARVLENGPFIALIVSPDPPASIAALGEGWH